MTDETPPDDPADRLPRQGQPRRSTRFTPGQSGNPSGPAPGRRNPAFVALDAIGQENAADIIRAVVEKAKGGDLKAAEILLRRAWPERKGRPLRFTMPPVTDAADLPAAMAAVSLAVSSGDLTPEEASAVVAVLELHRRVIEIHDHGARLAALEAALPATAR